MATFTKRKEGKKVQKRSIYISQQVLKAVITNILGIVNIINITDITDIIIDITDIITDIADIVNIAVKTGRRV